MSRLNFDITKGPAQPVPSSLEALERMARRARDKTTIEAAEAARRSTMSKNPIDPLTALNVGAANALVQRTLKHVLEDGLTWREAAAYQIGKTRGIELDRLDKVVVLTKDAFLKGREVEPREVEPGRPATGDPDWPDRVAERGAYGTLELADNGDELAAAIDQERPVMFFYRRSVPRAERLHRNDTEHAGWKHVSPYELRESLRSGQEYVVGFDHDLEAIRNFRLDRIEGRVVSDPSIDYRPAINELGGVA